MRASASLAIILALTMLPGLGLAQEETAKPWEDWQPPEVQMPEPNAWEIYLLAGELEDEIYRRLRDEAGLPAEEERPGPPPALPEAVAVPGVEQGATALRLDMSQRSLEPETLAQLIREYAPVFSALEAAIAGEAQMPPLRTQQEIEEAFPRFASIRQFARMFAARSVYHMQNEHALSAALDGIAAMRIGADIGTGAPMITGLVQVACAAIGEAHLREAIPRLTGDEARIAANALRAAMAELATFADVVEGEGVFSRVYFIRTSAPEMLTRAEIEALAEDQQLPEGTVAFSAEDTWEALDAYHEDVLAEARKPWWQREPIEEPQNPLVATLVQAYERAGLRFAYMDARVRVTLAALAAQAYHADVGHYPATLDALVPGVPVGGPGRSVHRRSAAGGGARSGLSRASRGAA